MAKSDMGTIDWIARILVIIGALNWGLIALNVNLFIGTLGTVIFALVGLAGIWELIKLFR